MIGASSHDDALKEAKRSASQPIDPRRLQVWDGERYVDAYVAGSL